jgi:hypothetical protein
MGRSRCTWRSSCRSHRKLVNASTASVSKRNVHTESPNGASTNHVEPCGTVEVRWHRTVPHGSKIVGISTHGAGAPDVHAPNMLATLKKGHGPCISCGRRSATWTHLMIFIVWYMMYLKTGVALYPFFVLVQTVLWYTYFNKPM